MRAARWVARARSRFKTGRLEPPQIAIIAELSIPQCKLYRVDHKARALERLGCRVEVVNWWNSDACWLALQTCDLAIFYRVAAHPGMREVYEEAKRLGVPTLFETDDLIFDREFFSRHASVLKAPPQEAEELLTGVDAYRAALLLCDHAIASTEALAEQMRPLVSGRVFVVENGLDHEALAVAERIRREPLPRRDGTVVIGYGSGTRTHDADFAIVAPALAAILERFPNVELAIHGELELPAQLSAFGARIVRAPLLAWEDYLRAKATWDINLAPLEPTVFNEGKSAIKFLEAAAVAVPSVCSPTPAFREAIEHGVNGLLARSEEEWTTALSALVQRADLRASLGGRALETVRRRYDPDRLAERQLRPLLALLPSRGRGLRVLVVDDDVQERPEHPAVGLVKQEGVTVALFCAAAEPDATHPVQRSKVAGLDVFRVFVPDRPLRGQYWDAGVAARFGELAKAWRPDVVVVLGARRLGITLLGTAKSMEIPYVVVLAGDWWLRDPELGGEAEKFGPTAEDLRRYVSRSVDPPLAWHRYFEFRTILSGAAALVASDDVVQDLHLAHGVPARLFRKGALASVLREVTGTRVPGETPCAERQAFPSSG